MVSNPNGNYQLIAIHSNKCLGLKTANGTDVVQKNCDGSTNQQWQIIHHQQDYYQLQNMGNNLSLEVENANMNNGANVATAAFSNGSHQLWRFDQITSALQWTNPNAENGNSTEKLAAYPIPANDHIYLQLPFKDTHNFTIYGFTADGRMVLSQSEYAAGVISLDVSHLSAGWYYFVVVDETGANESKKILISR